MSYIPLADSSIAQSPRFTPTTDVGVGLLHGASLASGGRRLSGPLLGAGEDPFEEENETLVGVRGTVSASTPAPATASASRSPSQLAS